MKRSLVITFLLLVFFSIKKSYGQDFIKAFQEARSQYKAQALRQKVDSLLEACEQAGKYEIKGRIAYTFAVDNTKEQRFNDAIKYGKIGLESLAKDNPDNPNLNGLNYNIGRFYFSNEQYKESIEYHKKAISKDSSSRVAGKAYAEIGRCYRELGDYFKALDFFEKAFSLYREQKSYSSIIIQSINMAWTLENIGTAESLKKRYELLLVADSLSDLYQVSNPNYALLKNAMAYHYTLPEYFDFDRAKSYYLSNLRRGHDSNDSAILAMTYNNLSRLYNKEEKDSAEYWAQKGLELVQLSSDRTRLFVNLSDFHLHRKNYARALDLIHKGIENNLDTTLRMDQPPSRISLIGTPSKGLLMNTLHKKVEILNALYDEESNRSYLYQIISHTRAADQLSELIIDDNYTLESKLHWREDVSSLFLLGAQAAIQLDDLPQAFYFIEKNKAILLAEEIATNTRSSYLPKHLADRERMLKERILSLEAENLDQSRLFSVRNEFDELKDSIKIQYPGYVNKQLNIVIKDIDEVQKSLKDDQLMVTYLWGKPETSQERVIGLAISRQHIQSFNILVDSAMHSNLAQFRRLISDPLPSLKEQTDFNRVSHLLYKTLIPEGIFGDKTLFKELIIVPDGLLQNLPFEALLTHPESGRFLLQQVNIRYLYSYSFLKFSQELKRQKTKGRLLAYAPVKFRNELSELPFSKREAEAAASSLNGETIVGTRASKASFLKQSPDYQVLHLATHANTGDQHWIAFADSMLNLHELYTYQNNADLVVLSGCKTLLGENTTGEGVLSLTRGFFYSGSKSVVASAWNTNDQATAEIMTSFYDKLSLSEDKSNALNQAKREYLEKNELPLALALLLGLHYAYW